MACVLNELFTLDDGSCDFAVRFVAPAANLQMRFWHFA